MQKGAPNILLCLLLAPLCGSLPLLAGGRANLNDHWNVFGDFVYMRRSDIHNHSLVQDPNKRQCQAACPNYTVIDAKDLVQRFHFEPGYRVALTYSPNPKSSIEANFLYLAPWHGEKTRYGDKSLSFPLSNSDYSEDFTNADEARAKYTSHFWDAELNFWHHFTPRHVDYFALSGIAGLRYFNWNEQFKLSMTTPPDTSTYNIHTENKICGAQVGLDFQMNPTHWLTWEVFAKVGGFANYTEQKQFMGDLDNTVVLRHSERHKTDVGVFADVAASIGFQCLEHLNIHGGYQAMFFSGLSLAPEQISHGVGGSAGKKDYTHGVAIIQGLFVGLILSF